MSALSFDSTPLSIVRKNVRTLRIAIRAPRGEIRVTAPSGVSDAQIRAVLVERRDWIRRHQAAVRERAARPAQDPLVPLHRQALDYVTGETHFLWGRPLPLEVLPATRASTLTVREDRLRLTVPPGASREVREQCLLAGYARLLEAPVAALLDHWLPITGAPRPTVQVRAMRSRWGSCTPTRQAVRLNAELARLPPTALEAVLVHELTHFFVYDHGPRFTERMDRTLPDWREREAWLNRGRGTGARRRDPRRPRGSLPSGQGKGALQ